VTRAAVVVTDDPHQARTEAAEFIDLASTGGFDWSKVVPLNRLVADAPALMAGFTLFKSLGAGIEDLAAASLVFDEAMERGIGVRA
jgi:ornithine cyclodeaminase/alanine dehydrogenase-like protein (mu-crystallin family)